MNAVAIKKQLRKLYPQSPIIPTTIHNGVVTEMIAEVESDGKRSIAIAVIDESDIHHHTVATEVYTVIKGSLTVFIDDTVNTLRIGEKITILPGQKHFAKGKGTWIEVMSTPPFSQEDFRKD